MRLLTPIALVCLVTAVAVAEIIREGSLQARSDGSAVILTWITNDETNVVRFEIERRMGTSGNFGYIASVTPKGPSLYEFIDHSALKLLGSTLYQYQIKIIFTNSPPEYAGPVTVTHSVSGVKRTWGSIKAMFR